MKTTIVAVVWILFALTGCRKISEKTQAAVNKGGEAVGKTATEFVDGVGEGIEKSLSLNIVVSQTLKDKGVSTGKYTVAGSDKGEDHILNLYIIFDKDFSGTVMVKAFDKGELEMGRVKTEISGKAGDAGYFQFVFDVRTNLENKGKIVIE